MEYEAWQAIRARCSDLVKREKSQNWRGTYPPHQVAVTEMAIREVYDEVRFLRERVEKLEAKRGPGRPPKDAA